MLISEVSEDVFAEYVRRVRATLHRRMYQRCGDWHQADDLVQKTLVILYTHWDAVADVDARTSYATTVMVHLLAREQTSRYVRSEQVQDHLPDCPEPDVAERLAERLRVQLALAQLPYGERAAVVLRFWAGLSTEEIATALGCPAGTVRSHLCRAFARLRTALQETA